MRRIGVPVRDRWTERLAAAGLPYGASHRPGGEPYDYWAEGTAFLLARDEAQAFTTAARELWRLAVALADELLGGADDLGLPLLALPAIQWSRGAGHPGLAARAGLRGDARRRPAALRAQSRRPGAAGRVRTRPA